MDTADPFLETGGALEQEVTRLTQENRELRQENSRLRARISLAATPSAAVSVAPSEHPSLRSVVDTAAISSRTSPGAGVVQKSGDTASARHTRSAGTAGAKPPPSQAASAARIEEAVQRVKKELRGEVDKYQKAAEAKTTQIEHLAQQFEHFVTTTCEREAAYELVYTQVFRELAEQRALVAAAEAQLEEQRLEAVGMRTALQAAVAAASASATARAAAPHVQSPPPTAEDVATETTSSSALPPAKKTRTRKAAAAAGSSDPPTAPEAQDTQEDAEEGEQGTDAPAPVPGAAEEPRRLRIVVGGAALRADPSRLKRPRANAAASSSSSVRPSRTHASATSLRMPAAPLFSSATATPASSDAVSVSATSAHAPAAPPTLMRQSMGDPVRELWGLLAPRAGAARDLLPLWQLLSRLRGPDRLTAMTEMIAVLLYQLGPADAPPPPPMSHASSPSSPSASSSGAAGASAPVTAVATAIRLLAMQLEDEAQQQHGAAVARIDAASQHCTALFHSLFYRVCVATLRRWQLVETGADAVESWATALTHLYGFQPAVVKLAQYTNATAAYEWTRLEGGWVAYTAHAIFAQCFASSSSSPSPSSSLSSAEAAEVRWRELCESVGWSPHSLPLERLEEAAARCVAHTRVGRGPYTPACAEEALLSLRLVVLYRGFDHLERVARLLELPGVLPMAATQEIYAELVSLAVMDGTPFRTADALQHALFLLREYVQEVAPERCTSAEHFVSVPHLSHLLATLALLRAEATAGVADAAEGTAATQQALQSCRQVALHWLQAQKVALSMVRQSPALAADRRLPLRDTELGQRLLREVSSSAAQ
ncbi:hypothetical protein NESM_000746700 [Novymonas esmeraldas]|uniref:Uncharacterized protein n=1 Tax=Novymonas esmeraldas TaxID=1808958 RepID=A0AAW0EXX0_9TRYP